jgi:hypothetical protein
MRGGGDVRQYLEEDNMRDLVKAALCTGLKKFAEISPRHGSVATAETYTIRDTQHAHEGEVCGGKPGTAEIVLVLLRGFVEYCWANSNGCHCFLDNHYVGTTGRSVHGPCLQLRENMNQVTTRWLRCSTYCCLLRG